MPQAAELVLFKKKLTYSYFSETENTFIIKALRTYFASDIFIYPTQSGETFFRTIFSRKARMPGSLSELVIYLVAFCLKQDFGAKTRIQFTWNKLGRFSYFVFMKIDNSSFFSGTYGTFLLYNALTTAVSTNVVPLKRTEKRTRQCRLVLWV